VFSPSTKPDRFTWVSNVSFLILLLSSPYLFLDNLSFPFPLRPCAIQWFLFPFMRRFPILPVRNDPPLDFWRILLSMALLSQVFHFQAIVNQLPSSPTFTLLGVLLSDRPPVRLPFHFRWTFFFSPPPSSGSFECFLSQFSRFGEIFPPPPHFPHRFFRPPLFGCQVKRVCTSTGLFFLIVTTLQVAPVPRSMMVFFFLFTGGD